MRKLVILTTVVLFAGTACWPFDDDNALSTMTLRRDSGDGRIEVHREGGVIAVKHEVSLEPRDVIVTKDDASAKLQLEKGRLAMIAPNSQNLIVDTSTIETQDGSLLADASAPMTVTFSGAEARLSDALFRVDRAPGATRAATYRGRVRVSAPGQRLALPALFQTSVSGSDVDSPDPYRLDEKDPWDITYLEDVLALDEQLSQIAAGLASQVGKARPTVGYFGGLAQGEKVSFMKSYLARRIGTADLLIGFTVGLEADGPLAAGVRRAFELFDDGARWGVAATIMDVREDPLIATLEGIIVAAGVASGSGEAPDFSAAAGVLAAAPGPVDPGDVNPSDPTDPTGPNPDPDPDKPDKPDEPQDCENAIDCAAKDLQDQIPGGSSPSPSPSSVLDDLP